MNNSTKIIIALLSASIILVGGGAMMIHSSDDSEANTNPSATFDYTKNVTLNVGKDHYFSFKAGTGINDTWTINIDDCTLPSFVTYNSSSKSFSGTTPNSNTQRQYTINCVGTCPSGSFAVNLIINILAAQDYDNIIEFDYTTEDFSLEVVSDERIVLKAATGYNHDWSFDPFYSIYPDWIVTSYYDGTFVGVVPGIVNGIPSGGTTTEMILQTSASHLDDPVFITITIHIVGADLSVTYNEPTVNAIESINWTHKIINETGVTITVTGVNTSWIHVNGNTIYGVPPTIGDYNVTVTFSKPGYEPVTETFTLTAVGILVATNSPASGALFFV